MHLDKTKAGLYERDIPFRNLLINAACLCHLSPGLLLLGDQASRQNDRRMGPSVSMISDARPMEGNY